MHPVPADEGTSGPALRREFFVLKKYSEMRSEPRKNRVCEVIHTGLITVSRIDLQRRTIQFQRSLKLNGQVNNQRQQIIHVASLKGICLSACDEPLDRFFTSAVDLGEPGERSEPSGDIGLTHSSKEGHITDDADPNTQVYLHGGVPESRPPRRLVHVIYTDTPKSRPA
jgi:hypothetical protein